jgi:AraC-like DNA-binding protein
MDSDTLSDALMKMKLKSTASAVVSAAGKWAIEYPTFEGFKLQILLKGERYVVMDGSSKILHLKSGDCILMTGRKPLVVASDPSVKKRIKLEELLSLKKDGVMAINGGGELLAMGTYFQFDGHLPNLLFESLPPYIYVAGHSDQAAILRWSLERFQSEFFSENPGRALILNHLAPIMLLQILRIYLGSVPKNKQNWLCAISDPQMSRVFEVMHSQYHRPWSLESLAKVAGLSRSGFALSFRKKVGISPLDYLTNWRMHIACNLLRAEDQTIASIANAVGYESESAFSLAFKRVLKLRPGAYQKTILSNRPTSSQSSPTRQSLLA